MSNLRKKMLPRIKDKHWMNCNPQLYDMSIYDYGGKGFKEWLRKMEREKETPHAE